MPDHDPGLNAAQHPPFGVGHPDVAADTVGGLSISRTLTELLDSDVTPDAVAQTAAPSEARRILGESPFMRAMAEAVVAETLSEVVLEPGTAYRLGVYMGAATIEATATQLSSYGTEVFADDIYNRADDLHETGAGIYRAEDRLSVWQMAMRFLEEGARRRLAESMMLELQEHASALSVTQAAQVAEDCMHRLGEAEGTDAGVDYNPITRLHASVVEGAGGAAFIVTQTPDSRLIDGMVSLLGEDATDEGDAEELYEQGVQRVLAFVALGTGMLASREPLPDIDPSAV